MSVDQNLGCNEFLEGAHPPLPPYALQGYPTPTRPQSTAPLLDFFSLRFPPLQLDLGHRLPVSAFLDESPQAEIRIIRTVSAFAEFHATTRGTASQTVKGLSTTGQLVLG